MWGCGDGDRGHVGLEPLRCASRDSPPAPGWEAGDHSVKAAFSRVLGASPVWLTGAYAASVTLPGADGTPFALGVLGWVLLLFGLALPSRSGVPVGIYGFGGATLLAVVLAPGEAEIPRGFVFLGWLAFALSMGALKERDGEGQEAAELHSEGHEPHARGGTLWAFAILVSALVAAVSVLWGGEPERLEYRILGRVLLVSAGVLIVALAGTGAGGSLPKNLRTPKMGRRSGVALILWAVSSLALLAAAHAWSESSFPLASCAFALAFIAGGLGLRSLRPPRES